SHHLSTSEPEQRRFTLLSSVAMTSAPSSALACVQASSTVSGARSLVMNELPSGSEGATSRFAQQSVGSARFQLRTLWTPHEHSAQAHSPPHRHLPYRWLFHVKPCDGWLPSRRILRAMRCGFCSRRPRLLRRDLRQQLERHALDLQPVGGLDRALPVG